MHSRQLRAFFAMGIAATLSVLSTTAFATEISVIESRSLTLYIDIDHCEWGSSLCVGSGSVGPAADGNDSVVQVVIDIKNQLGPIGGLVEADFSTVSVTNPGGVTPVFVDTTTCPACFAEPEPGVYRLAARPAFGNWSVGTYFTVIEVTLPSGNVATAVVPFDIPL